MRAACPKDKLEFIFSEPSSVLYLVLACYIKCRFAFLIIQGRNAYSESSRKRKLSEGEKGVRNWSSKAAYENVKIQSLYAKMGVE